MLLLGQHRCRTCAGACAPRLRADRGQLRAGPVAGRPAPSARLGRRRTKSSARSVLLLWLWGGPAQLDTWDPKPDAPLEYRGPFAAIPTRTVGVRIGELFPKIADLTPKFAVLRSLHTRPTITASPAPSA